MEVEKIKLGQLVEHMLPSDRLLILDEDRTEIYKGYVGCFKYQGTDRNREVREVRLHTEIFKRENARRYQMGPPTYTKAPVSMEHLSDFKYSDLEMLIYSKITLEGAEKRPAW